MDRRFDLVQMIIEEFVWMYASFFQVFHRKHVNVINETAFVLYPPNNMCFLTEWGGAFSLAWPNSVNDMITNKYETFQKFYFNLDRMYLYWKEECTLNNHLKHSAVTLKTFPFFLRVKTNNSQLFKKGDSFSHSTNSIHNLRKCERALWVQGGMAFSGLACVNLFVPCTHVKIHY